MRMDPKQKLHQYLKNALSQLNVDTDIEIERPSDPSYGDFSTNVAMQLARTLKKAPKKIAEELVSILDLNPDFVQKVTIAGPGFINFYIEPSYYHRIIGEILEKGAQYGDLDLGKGELYNIEYVSANPTGHLHIGHARGAAAGDAMTRILKKAGFKVTREFYVNDGGQQIDNLTKSIAARYQQAFDQDISLPKDGYYGKEIKDIAAQIKAQYGDRFLHEDGYAFFKETGLKQLLARLRADLESFGVTFDVWFYESKLYQTQAIEQTLADLKDKGYTYEADGAVWLKTSAFGDEKDRVIIRSDGNYTYIMPDIAYHRDKLKRGYTKLIDILGGDHHGYVPRLKAAIEMISGEKNMLEVDLLQMVKVMQDGQEIKMSKRSGESITLNDLIAEVGKDAIRYFFAMRSLNTHMDLDLDLALKETNENPVFYAQYAHARMASLLRQAQEKAIKIPTITHFETLQGEAVHKILTLLAYYPKAIEEAALKRIPHKMTHYIHDLAQALHTYYAKETIITGDNPYTHERLTLILAVKTVLGNALTLVGVDPKERM